MEQHIQWIYHILPIGLGAILAGISLAQKYPTTLKYAYSTHTSKLYLAFAASGSWLTTQIMKTVGTKVIDDDFINSILVAILGVGAFLGIISKVSILSKGKGQTESHLNTIRDFIFEYLDGSISRQVMQKLVSRIRGFQRIRDKEWFLEEADRLLRGTNLTTNQKEKKMIEFDEL